MKKTGLKKRPVWRRILLSLIALALLGGVAVGILNAVVLLSTENRIHENAEAAAESLGGSWDCILVLGAGVRADGTPSVESPVNAEHIPIAKVRFCTNQCSKTIATGIIVPKP